jgi:hypothetical protein
MKCNIGRTDRILRITIGSILMGLAAFQIIGPWAWFGIIPLITGLIGNCSAYSLLGVNTATKSAIKSVAND